MLVLRRVSNISESMSGIGSGMRKLMRAWRTAVALLLLFGVAACEKNKPFELPESGKYYKVRLADDTFFACLDTVIGKTAQGTYYAVRPGWESAGANKFSVASGKRGKISISARDFRGVFETSDISWEAYVEPPFSPVDTALYRDSEFEVEVTEDICYGHAMGYWTSLAGAEADVSKVFTEGYVHSFIRKRLPLTLDLYRPKGLNSRRPLILFLHGGAFYVGDKQEPAYKDFCEYFASLGYVAASVNYRLGFHLGKKNIERAGYTAMEDARTAMLFLLSKAREYGIDRNEIYAVGSSAGSIAALTMAFDENASFKVHAVANMWGAVNDLGILKNSRTDIVSFHGDADRTVPYGEDYPFTLAGEGIAKMLSDKMYGSSCIDAEARRLGLRSSLYTFEGEGHALNTTKKDKLPNENHYFIRKAIKEFFFEEMIPEKAWLSDDGMGVYTVHGKGRTSVQWKVEGGFFLKLDGDTVKILWREDAPLCRITAAGKYSGGIGYSCSLEP